MTSGNIIITIWEMASGYARTGSSRKPPPIDMGKLRRSHDAYNIEISVGATE